MYEKNADIMDSLRNAKNSVADGAISLLQKIRGSSQNDVDNAVRSQLPPDIASGISGIRDKVQSQLPSDVSQIVDNLRSQTGGQLADKATKLLGEGGRKLEDRSPSALSYIPAIGGYLSGLVKPPEGRGRFVSSVGEGVSGALGGVAGGALGGAGSATLIGIVNLIASLLSKGKYRPRINHMFDAIGRPMVTGAGIGGGMLGTHAGAGLFHDIATKEKKAELTPILSANRLLAKKRSNPFGVEQQAKSKADKPGIEAALAKRGSQNNASPPRSAAGDSNGLKCKLQRDDHATGAKALVSLDRYTRDKRAGLTNFQSSFFSRLIQEGCGEQHLYEAVKQAGEQFGRKVGEELLHGLEKLSSCAPVYKQSREKQAVGGLLRLGAKALQYMGLKRSLPGAAIQKVIDGSKATLPTSGVVKEVLKSVAPRAGTGAATGFFNPYTGAFAEGDPDGGVGDWLKRVGVSTGAGAVFGAAGGKGTQEMMRRMSSAGLLGQTADFGASLAGIDTHGMLGKGGFLAGAALPAKTPKWLGARGNRMGGGHPESIGTDGVVTPFLRGNTSTLLQKADPFYWLGKGVGKGVEKIKSPIPWMAANKVPTAVMGTGAALGLGGGMMANNALGKMQGMRDEMTGMNEQFFNLRNETNRNLGSIRNEVAGGVGGMGQFFTENKHWLLPLLLAGGGALAGGALGGQSGATLGGLSLPALYLMYQSGMFGGGDGGGGGGGGGQPPPTSTATVGDRVAQIRRQEQEAVDKQHLAMRNTPVVPVNKPT